MGESIKPPYQARNRQLFIAALRVAEAYRAAIEYAADETERLRLEEGLRDSVSRAEAYQQVLSQARTDGSG